VNSKYKIYIDSLRGIAVGIIILFHFNFHFFSGGFVGVDIFFVISGFLVTSKIIGGTDTQSFSYTEFYANRIRRIFPALFIVLIGVLLFEWVFFDYEKFREAGASVSSISLFLSNVLYWRQSGYFENFSVENPLLHIWSLSVEEQFYFFLPLIIILSKRFLQKRFSLSLIVIAVLSFLLFCIGTFRFPDATFYFLPTRMWEFLIGSLLSTVFLAKNYSIKQLNILSVVGFLLLAGTIYLNYIHLLPVSGSIFLSVISAALIIISGFNNKSLTNQLLNHNPLIFIGKISYSLYLWHWPVYCIATYIVNGELNGWQVAVCMGITFILAWLSWYFVEVPFRKTFFWITNKALTYRIFAAASCIMLIAGIVIYQNKGFPKRFVENDKLLNINEHLDKWVKLQVLVSDQFEKGEALVKLGAEKEPPSFLIWGDSHALGLSASIGNAAKKNNVAGYFLTRAGAAPVLHIDDKNDPSHGMLNFNNAVIDFIKKHTEIKTIFLSCRWPFHFVGPYLNEIGVNAKYIDVDSSSGEKDDSVLVRIGLNRTVQKLLSLNRKVVIINEVPEQKYDVAKYYIKKRIYNMFHQSFSVSPITTTDYLARNRSANNAFEAVTGYQNVTILRTDKIFQAGDNYLAIAGNNPLYRDNNHLSFYGLAYVEPLFDDYFHSHP